MLNLKGVGEFLRRALISLKVKKRKKKTKKRQLLLLLGAVILPLVYLLLLSLLKVELPEQQTNLVFDLYLGLAKSIINYWYLSFGVVIGLLGLSFFLAVDRRNRPFLYSPLLSLAFLSISLVVLLPSLLLIATIHLNSLSLKTNLTSGVTKVFSGKDAVLAELKQTNIAPKITGGEGLGVQKAILGLEVKRQKFLGELYAKKIINVVPSWLVFPVSAPNESLVLYGNNLIVTTIKKDEIEAVSPTIGKLFVSQYLDPKYIKDEPKTQVMGRQEYMAYREGQINKTIEEIDTAIVSAQRNLNTLYAGIQQSKENIATLEAQINESISLRDQYYNSCKTAGYYSYYLGFIRYYSDSQCDSRRAEWDVYIAKAQASITENQQYIQDAQGSIPWFQDLLDNLNVSRGLLEAQKSTTPQELGIFEPPDLVKVVLDTTSSNSLADYFVTVIHEYLHYTSYVSEERAENFPHFFEESLTEYFARKTIQQELQVSTGLGYPVFVKIIEQMMKQIPEEKFKEIYFVKDFDQLHALLNEAYGKNFYEDSEVYFEVMPYLGLEDSLKYANNIMFRIGGEELSEEDLLSTYSELN